MSSVRERQLRWEDERESHGKWVEMGWSETWVNRGEIARDRSALHEAVSRSWLNVEL